jgi:hypothetical protein
VTSVYEDGTVQVINEMTNEEWFGRLIVMSGGMICFDLVDERLTPIGHKEVSPERGEAPDSARIPKRTQGTHVRLGGKKKGEVEAPVGDAA